MATFLNAKQGQIIIAVGAAIVISVIVWKFLGPKQSKQKITDATDDNEEWDEAEILIDENNDCRQKIYETKYKDDTIIACIGELRMLYSYNQQHSYKAPGFGTATVFHCNKDQRKAYAITVAHNFRQRIKECTSCKQWMPNVKQINQCQKCKNDLQTIWMKPTEIQFQRRVTEYKDYGKWIHSYPAKIEYTNDTNYMQYPSVRGGYDLAIISFIVSNDRDMTFYLDHSTQIQIQMVKQNLKISNNFMIFGYPRYSDNGMDKDKNGKMVGMDSSNERTAYSIEIAARTKKTYFRQQAIDCTQGQSGAAIWYKSYGIYTIFAIHSGGNRKERCNYGTLIDKNVYRYIQQIGGKCTNEQSIEQKKENPVVVNVYGAFDTDKSHCGTNIEFIGNSKVKKITGGHWSTCLFGSARTDNFKIEFKRNKAAAGIDMGYITSTIRESIKTWDERLGNRANNAYSTGIEITKGLNIFYLNDKENSSQPLTPSETRFVGSDTFGLQFDFKKDKVVILHNGNGVASISLNGCKSVIPGFSLYCLGDEIEVIYCK